MPRLLKKTFSARIDKVPGGGKGSKFTVAGMVEVPTSDWSGSLVPDKKPGGANIFLIKLDTVLQKPTGPVTKQLSQIEVRYEESPPAFEYTEALVRLIGDSVTVQVESTS